jgi:hypothetical protein
MAAEISLWVADGNSESAPEQTYRRKVGSRPSAREAAMLEEFMHAAEAAFRGKAADEDIAGYPRTLRLAGATVELAVEWDRLDDWGSLIETLASRSGLRLYFPDAGLLGGNPSSPDWREVQVAALRQLDEAWRMGHAMESGDDSE